MKNADLPYCRVIACVFFVAILGGCISVPNTATPRFYMLHAIDLDSVNQKYDLAAGTGIEVGPIKIPEFLNRPQIVTQNKEGMLAFSEFDRWGDSLDLSLARLINENLTVMLPGANVHMFPSNLSIPVKYQVVVDVLQIDSELDRSLSFVVQWSLIDVENNKMVSTKRSEFQQTIDPHNYAGLTESLSAQCASLSEEIAQKISTEAAKPPNP